MARYAGPSCLDKIDKIHSLSDSCNVRQKNSIRPSGVPSRRFLLTTSHIRRINLFWALVTKPVFSTSVSNFQPSESFSSSQPATCCVLSSTVASPRVSLPLGLIACLSGETDGILDFGLGRLSNSPGVGLQTLWSNIELVCHP